MLRLGVDLHIHSCLSPCAEEEMTPCNIAGMASLKGLTAIAVCDHNACLNALACAKACARYGILAVPGVEATTAEELHALCYFPTFDALLDFCNLLEARRPFVPNRPDFFGEQIIMDENDNEKGRSPSWLGTACSLSVEEMEWETLARGGVLVPAHINRPTQSLLANLGFIPPGLKARTMEVKGEYALPEGYRPIRSSDAHSLGMMLEPGFPLDVGEATIEGTLEALRNGNPETHV